MKRKLGILIIFLLVMVGGLGAYIYTQAHELMGDIYSDAGAEEIREQELEPGEPFSVLLLGIDREESEVSGGRSDTIIVATVNPQKQSVILQSIERDTLVPLAGTEYVDKINHAYAFGGAQMAINTVQDFLEIPIDYYVEIDMGGLVALIDAVGGITVVNEQVAFKYHGYKFPLGELELGGYEALAYSRMRKEDPEGDYGRQRRQRAVITAIVKKAATFQPGRYEAILEAVGSHLKTNLTLNRMLSLAARSPMALKHIEEYSLRGEDAYIEGVYYSVVSEEDRVRVVQRLREHLLLDEEKALRRSP